MDLQPSKSDNPPSWIRNFRRTDWIFLMTGTATAVTVGLFGNWVIGFGFVLFMVVCIIIFIHGANLQQEREAAAAAWSELAAGMGLEFKRSHLYPFEDLSMNGLYRGRRVSIANVLKEKSYGEVSITGVFTRMFLEVNNTSGCGLTMREKPLLNKIFKFGGVTSGNENFNRRFRFDGRPVALLQEAQQLIVQHPILLRRPGSVMMLKDPLSWRPPSIQLQGSQLICLQSGVPIHIPGQVEILNLLCDLAELAEGMRSESAK